MSQNQVYAWEQRPDYIAACQTVIPPGGQTAYNPPRRPGADSGDRTDFQYGQRNWSLNNLPNVLYQLAADDDWNDFKQKHVPYKHDANGNLVYEQWPADRSQPEPLRYFPILANIDQICTQEEPLIIEAWRRLDPRIATKDIMMRMQHHGRGVWNARNTAMGRTWRPNFSIASWNFKGMPDRSTPSKALLDSLSPAQRQQNTTRGTTPGLIDPLVPGSGSVALPPLGPYEGYPRYPTALPGYQGLTRNIMPWADEPGPSRRSGGSMGTASARPTLDDPSSAASGSGTQGASQETRRPRRGHQPATDAGQGESDSDDDMNAYIDDVDPNFPTLQRRPRNPRPPHTPPRARSGSRAAEVEAPSAPEPDWFTDNSNDYLAAQGRSPLRMHADTRRQRRVGTRPEIEPYRLIHRETNDGWTFPTGIFGSGRLGQDPFAQPNGSRPSTDDEEVEEEPHDDEDNGEGSSRRS